MEFHFRKKKKKTYKPGFISVRRSETEIANGTNSWVEKLDHLEEHITY